MGDKGKGRGDGQGYGINWKLGAQKTLPLRAKQVKIKTKAEHRINVGCSEKRLDR